MEPTSGNQGIGLSLVGAVRGYTVRIIMPDSVSEERRKLCRAYGAEVILVHDEGNIGECIDECMRIASKMAEEDPRVYMPQQFVNPDNPAVHKLSTAQEILADVEGPIHGFCCGIGTGGTISGVGEALKLRILKLKFGQLNPSMLQFFQVEKWVRTCRWELGMA